MALPEAGECGSPTVLLPHSPRRTFRLVQVLRAVAALMVVWHHATMLLEQRTYRPVTWYSGAAGVDVFFVISGLVMTLSTARVRWGGAAAWVFLKRRLERVVPLYWLATTAKVVGTVLLPGLALHTVGTSWHVVASYLFWPSFGPGGTFEPTLVSGWTLNLEMLFYLLIAASLAAGVRAAAAVVPALAALAVIGMARLIVPWNVLSFWTNPVLLEFVWGMALGWVVLRATGGRRLPDGVGWGRGGAGFCALVLTPSMPISVWRPALWGGPAAAIVGGALLLEERWGDRVPRPLLLLGDASYSIYLTHAFVLPLLGAGRLGPMLMRPERAFAVGLAGLLLSCWAGVMCYRLVELPMLEWFRLRRRTALV